jgi:PPK2 family polyphosphate:nucleotide phosphotransferase
VIVQPGSKAKLADRDPRSTLHFRDKESAQQATLADAAEINRLQDILYAEGARALLVVLQGMDTAGKGGIVEHVVGAANPQGIRYTSFGIPTPEERAHHYLWRIRRALPPAGHIGVFDRSHYEDVLIVRVHNLVPPEVWSVRYDEINTFERELVNEGTTLVKVAMFVSLDEQKRRLAARLERPDKYWKYNPGDVDERKLWPLYQDAYQAVLDRTSTDYAPWFVVPCDRKWYSRLAVTELLIKALEDLNLAWPPPDFDVEAEVRRLEDA